MNNLEEFREVKGYEGIYEVSNFGSVKSLSREKLIRGKYPFLSKEKTLKAGVNAYGYLQVSLHKNGKKSTKKIHKLVAIAFSGHIADGYKVCVDHIDNNKLNNHVSNLQLISARENVTKDSKNKYSKYKGVSYNKRYNTWIGIVQFQGKNHRTKSCKTEDEAYELYKILLSELGMVNYNEK